MTHLHSLSPSTLKQGLVVELVGPAGAGKTSLFRALAHSAPYLRPAELPPVWNIAYLPFYIKNLLLLTPYIGPLSRKTDRRLTRRELAWMAILNGWPQRLNAQTQARADVLLLDQGPVFLMAALSGFGPQSLSSPRLTPWWQQIYERWAGTIDSIVWLDAPDATLAQRIRDRASDHLVKARPDPEIHSFLATYRQLYRTSIDRLKTLNPSIKVNSINTGQFSVDEIAKLVRSETQLELARRA